MMLRRLKFLIGADPKASSPLALPAPESKCLDGDSSSLVPEALHEIAVYIHRFHNLDLFQQGWYQLKVSMRWEGSDEVAPGFPARVVQYEAPDSVLEDTAAVWKINDADHSFCTRPFRIKYARQDVLLSVMVSFNLSRFLTSPVLLKFELLYAPTHSDMNEVQYNLDNFPASVHEIRVPPKALLGLHSYCPLHFDTLHMVLVDMSVHVVLLKAASSVSSQNFLSECQANSYSEFQSVTAQAIRNGESGVDSMDIALWKTLCASRDTLLNELHSLSRAIDKKIDELDDTEDTSIQLVAKKLDGKKTEAWGFKNGMIMEMKSRLEESAIVLRTVSEPENWPYKTKGGQSSELSRIEMLEGLQSLGSQLSSIWNAFLRFHRKYRIPIMEYLHKVWAEDRNMEWSLWLVHSEMDIPQHNSNNEVVEENGWAIQAARKTPMRKSHEDPAVAAASRADLHRKGIEQMKINSTYLQDLQIYGKIALVPIISVEHHTVQCQKLSKVKEDTRFGFTGSLEQEGVSITPMTSRGKLPPKLADQGTGRSGRVLKVVVFVHGFQGHHLDLRLVRNQWLLIDPGAQCLMSEANEDRTTCDFRELGQRLAEEVATFLKNKFISGSRSATYESFKLSFVGHSIGNIIIRSALTDAAMKPYLNNLYTFLSISGPHLGYLYSTNTLFNSGLWLFKKLKGSPCMHQLTFTDEAELQNSFLFKLSEEKTFEHFQNLILVSSPQDRYVPYHSARIERCQAATRDLKKGPAYTTMLKKCLDQILLPDTNDRTFIRCDVNFDTSSQARTLNNLIGRAAHIEFLETDIFARFIMWSFAQLFI
ncbi:uncharacterized protein LOC131060560 isoform X2 [Cryptomeria japonica]|uniref:uncharacterized protein LOC131060560 isoform X2 n=1 Tax=Cryptomeria japonica TaxID=3369 RepID=UPI0025ABC14D|nr:uncharacterized protein LOC131060560 isoform X2 [Cryptomeria japonica]